MDGHLASQVGQPLPSTSILYLSSLLDTFAAASCGNFTLLLRQALRNSLDLSWFLLEHIPKRLGTSAQVVQYPLAIAFLVVSGAGIDIGHAVSQGVVEQHRDLARRGGHCFSLTDAGSQPSVEGPQGGLGLPEGHRRPTQRRCRPAGGTTCLRGEDFASGDLVAGSQS